MVYSRYIFGGSLNKHMLTLGKLCVIFKTHVWLIFVRVGFRINNPTSFNILFVFQENQGKWNNFLALSVQPIFLKTMNGASGETLPTTFKGIRLQMGYVYNSFIALSCLNILLAIAATIGNTLIFFALGRKSSLHAPSRLLIRCLTFTDLCVGVITQPLAALHAISILTEHLSIFRFTVVSSYVISAILSGVSLFILTFISVDRLLALSLGVRYRQTVTVERVRLFVVFIWAVNIANGTSLFAGKKFIFYIICLAGILLCVVISTFCYGKICRTLRAQQMKVQTTFSQGNTNELSPLHIERYKKTVSSALWVHLTLLACYLPFSIVSGMKALTGDTFAVAEGFTATLVFFNSSLNPVLYCWRIREVRQAVKETIREYCDFSNEARSDTNEETQLWLRPWLPCLNLAR